jgi:hypothetical protein
MLLYSTTDEAKEILSAAKARGLTGRNYVWIATQSIIGSNPVTPDEFPIGMLGKQDYKASDVSLFIRACQFKDPAQSTYVDTGLVLNQLDQPSVNSILLWWKPVLPKVTLNVLQNSCSYLYIWDHSLN